MKKPCQMMWSYMFAVPYCNLVVCGCGMTAQLTVSACIMVNSCITATHSILVVLFEMAKQLCRSTSTN